MKTTLLPPEWDTLYPTLSAQWEQVAHELAELLLEHSADLNQTDPMRHYHAVARRQAIEALRKAGSAYGED